MTSSTDLGKMVSNLTIRLATSAMEFSSHSGCESSCRPAGAGSKSIQDVEIRANVALGPQALNVDKPLFLSSHPIVVSDTVQGSLSWIAATRKCFSNAVGICR